MTTLIKQLNCKELNFNKTTLIKQLYRNKPTLIEQLNFNEIAHL